MEQLKSIIKFPGYYADNLGNIYSGWTNHGINPNKRKKLHPHVGSNGYQFLQIRIANNTYYHAGVHRLVCLAFRGNPPKENYSVSHLDGNRQNNVSNNLIWETLSDNFKRKLLHGTHDRGYNNSKAKINKQTLIKIKDLLASKKYTHKQIGDIFGLNRVFITKINTGQRYKGL